MCLYLGFVSEVHVLVEWLSAPTDSCTSSQVKTKCLIFLHICGIWTWIFAKLSCSISVVLIFSLLIASWWDPWWDLDWFFFRPHSVYFKYSNKKIYGGENSVLNISLCKLQDIYISKCRTVWLSDWRRAELFSPVVLFLGRLLCKILQNPEKSHTAIGGKLQFTHS